MKTFRNLFSEEIDQLQRQGCASSSWDDVWVAAGFDPLRVKNVTFSGVNYLGRFSGEIDFPGGVKKKTGIYNALLHNCRTGDEVFISNIRNYVANYDIGDRVVIENSDLLAVEGETAFGNGTMVDVLDELGGRQLMIYDRLSAHLAYIMAFYRHRDQLQEVMERLIRDYSARVRSNRGYIGAETRIASCSQLINVRIGEGAVITGASRLREGSINSNRHAPVIIGPGVVADHFIISSGAEVSDSAVLSNCFVGQGCILTRHYSATHSLFFSNCQGISGEACSVFAGPFTVTHHKSTLLIAGMFSFLNAGSGSNQSNHMYKLGPIHHGIVERGSKTTSDSYLLWPAKIGPFTLVMGRHHKNSDTANMPFSYLVENNDESWLVPGINLRSVGTIRDALKWPRRDKRKDPDLLDCINFNLLSPYTIQRMIKGRKILRQLQQIAGKTTETYTWETTFISRSSLERGITLYGMAITKFLGNSVISRIEKMKPASWTQLKACLEPQSAVGCGDWIDLAGLIAPKSEIARLTGRLEAGGVGSLAEVEQFFRELHARYYELEWCWAARLLEEELEKPLAALTPDDLTGLIRHWQESVIGLDRMLYEDAKKEFTLNAMTGFGIDGDGQTKEQDFLKVRGTFEKNTFVTEILEHIRRKGDLGDRIIHLLEELQKTEKE